MINDVLNYEEEAYNLGFKLIAGIDEAGRGPLAGPVVAACVILPRGLFIEGLTDSKKLSKKKRNLLFKIINEEALSIGIGIIDAKTIDQVNILEATKLAMIKAIKNGDIKPDYLLIDAVKLKTSIETLSLIKGDVLSHSISAASVIAKVTRDAIMDKLATKYPPYLFEKNAGYPTKAHISAIKKHGISKEHRKSYGPVKKYLENL